MDSAEKKASELLEREDHLELKLLDAQLSLAQKDAELTQAKILALRSQGEAMMNRIRADYFAEDMTGSVDLSSGKITRRAK